MTPETMTALRASIQHWRENVAAEAAGDVKTGPKDCALCQMFFDQGDGCEGCPVMAKTGNSECLLSPYRRAFHAFINWGNTPNLTTEAAFRAAAQAELDFLISLLPEGETP